MTFSRGFEGFIRMLAEASRSGDLGEAHTPGLHTITASTGSNSLTFPDVGPGSSMSVRLQVRLGDWLHAFLYQRPDIGPELAAAT